MGQPELRMLFQLWPHHWFMQGQYHTDLTVFTPFSTTSMALCLSHGYPGRRKWLRVEEFPRFGSFIVTWLCLPLSNISKEDRSWASCEWPWSCLGFSATDSLFNWREPPPPPDSEVERFCSTAYSFVVRWRKQILTENRNRLQSPETRPVYVPTSPSGCHEINGIR